MCTYKYLRLWSLVIEPWHKLFGGLTNELTLDSYMHLPIYRYLADIRTFGGSKFVTKRVHTVSWMQLPRYVPRNLSAELGNFYKLHECAKGAYHITYLDNQ